MSSDPNAPTPAGPDPDEETRMHQTPSDPFAPPVGESAGADDAAGSVAFDPPAASDTVSDADREPLASDAYREPLASDAYREPLASDADREPLASDADREPLASDAYRDEPLASDPSGDGETGDRAPDPAFAPPTQEAASVEQPDAETDPGATSLDRPSGAAELPGDEPAGSPSSATLGGPAGTAAPDRDWLEPDSGATAATPEPDPIVRTPSAFTPLGTPESGSATPLEQAKAFAERPEGMVVLAFVGGALASFVLKRFGR